MQAFTTVTGVAAVLPLRNLNTDVIIRIERLTLLEPHQLGPWAMESLRYLPDGQEDPRFVLNQPPFRQASILIGGDNFGCGSSREAAVWALLAQGIRCIVAPSFGDIFFNNCFENGLLAIAAPPPVIAQLSAHACTTQPITVDLPSQTLIANGHRHAFGVDPLHKEALLKGMNSIELTLLMADRIRVWQERDRQQRRWAWFPGATHPGRASSPLPADHSAIGDA